jgi:hypothetical protein
MKVFEVVLNGFNGGTDETDHLVKWVSAESESHVKLVFDSLNPTKGYKINSTDIHPDCSGIDMVLKPSLFKGIIPERTEKDIVEQALKDYEFEDIATNKQHVREGVQRALMEAYPDFLYEVETTYNEDIPETTVALRSIQRGTALPLTTIYSFT